MYVCLFVCLRRYRRRTGRSCMLMLYTVDVQIGKKFNPTGNSLGKGKRPKILKYIFCMVLGHVIYQFGELIKLFGEKINQKYSHLSKLI